jgi:hypothetical protein
MCGRRRRCHRRLWRLLPFSILLLLLLLLPLRLAP